MMEDGGIMVELGMQIIIAGGIKYAIVRRVRWNQFSQSNLIVLRCCMMFVQVV